MLLKENVLLKEFKDGTLLTIRQVDLTDRKSVTFGRSSETDYKIGRGVQGCSRVQATLVRSGDSWLVVDGQDSKRSARGVWFLGEKIREPLQFGNGMEVDIFFGDGYRAELSARSPSQFESDDPPTQGFEAEAIALLRRDLDLIQQELNLQREDMIQMNNRIEAIGDMRAELRADMAEGFKGLSLEVRSAIAIANERDQRQEDRLKLHNEHLKYLTIGLAITMLSVCGWNATKAQEEVGKIANIAGMVASVAGLIYMRPGDRGEDRPRVPTLRESNG
jgi:FHA domain